MTITARGLLYPYDHRYQMPPPNISEILVEGGDYFNNNMFLNQVPGQYFQYANINYGLIATLIEVISETRFDLYMKQLLFDPLDIDGSFNIQDLQNIENLAVLYRDAIPQADNYNGIMPEPPEYNNYEIGSKRQRWETEKIFSFLCQSARRIWRCVGYVTRSRSTTLVLYFF